MHRFAKMTIMYTFIFLFSMQLVFIVQVLKRWRELKVGCYIVTRIFWLMIT